MEENIEKSYDTNASIDFIKAKYERIPWNQYFMAQSVLLSLRSTCTRLEVGATLVKDRRIIAGGL